MLHSIVGVDHVGIGVRDAERMRSFYREVFRFTRVLAEMPEADHPAIHGLLRAHRTVHSSTLVAHDSGGPTIALFHAIDPEPRAIRRDFTYGDIGVAKLTFTVPDLVAFCRDKGTRLSLCSPPKTVALEGRGEYSFVYGHDPEGNLIEIVSGHGQGADDPGSLCSVGIAVTDLDRSLAFYRDVFGFKDIVVAPHERFSGLVDEITGVERTAVRSCLLASGKGGGMLELIEVMKPRGRSIPFGTQWGDFGYLQVCLLGEDRETLISQVRAEGLNMLLPPQEVEDPDHPAMFMYLQDPDGIPVEIVVGG